MTAGRTVTGLSQDWCTPEKYVNAARKALGGGIDLDPCSNNWSVVGAKTEWRLPTADGLKREWTFKRIYVNPPYGSDPVRGTRIGDWLRKCAEAYDLRNSEVVALVPVAGNTRHWKDSVWGRARALCFLYDTRLRFLERGRDDGKGAPMACAAIYWGNDYPTFAAAFEDHGAVVNLIDVRVPRESRKNQLQLQTTLVA